MFLIFLIRLYILLMCKVKQIELLRQIFYEKNRENLQSSLK